MCNIKFVSQNSPSVLVNSTLTQSQNMQPENSQLSKSLDVSNIQVFFWWSATGTAHTFIPAAFSQPLSAFDSELDKMVAHTYEASIMN